MKSTVIILGSSRRNGNTENLAKKIALNTAIPIISLSDYQISEYDYEHKNIDDDFLKIIYTIIENYDQIIFATSVYWYAMSGKMKKFFDRLTDLLTVKKEVGRKLRGKEVGVVTSSEGDKLGDQFWLPFEKTFDYLGMSLLFHKHFIESIIDEKELDSTAELIQHNPQE